MNSALKLGDTVTGLYCDVVVTGTLVAFDGSGYVYVKPGAHTWVLGMARDLICFDRWARLSLKLVQAGPELTGDDVREAPADVLGGASLRSWKAAV